METCARALDARPHVEEIVREARRHACKGAAREATRCAHARACSAHSRWCGARKEAWSALEKTQRAREAKQARTAQRGGARVARAHWLDARAGHGMCAWAWSAHGSAAREKEKGARACAREASR